MATPDPSTLASSAQIFSGNHTLPQIRAIHKSLHVQIDEKANRLRTQVGSSYRELLGTADTIVRMRGENDQVQALLGHMGGRCGRGIIGAKVNGLAGFLTREGRPEVTEAARLKLLDACSLVVTRILKGGAGLPSTVDKGGRLVLASKVWVLSRLLVKSLGEELSNETARRAVETAKRTLGQLRGRLLRAIEKVLSKANEDQDREDALKALSAYSLVTSSGARDVLRHFLRTRGEAMGLAFDVEEEDRQSTTEDVIQSLNLYTQTLLDVQALVPGKLSQALAGLKKQHLLEDEELQQLEGLRLDIYERWCGDEIKYFTPYIRHDDLDGRQARDMLAGWTKEGGKVLLHGLRQTLEHMADFKSIVELRTSVLQLWIRHGGRVKGFDPVEMQDDLRDAINARMLAVVEIKVSKLHLVGSEVKATLEGWQEGRTDKHVGLWDEDGYDEALASGAAPFVQEVVSRLYGRNDAVSRTVHSYTSWHHVIDDVKDVVELLGKQRWDNDYDEVEDEETIETRQQLLSKDDPGMLQKRLDKSLDSSFKDLDNQINDLWKAKSKDRTSGAMAIYLLRILRDIRGELPKRPSIESFGLSVVASLHSRVASHVLAPVLDEFTKTVLSEKTVVGRTLWEGEPPLPNQPSPGVFQFLRSLSLSMADAGVDLWSPAAVVAIKEEMGERLATAWREVLESLSLESSSKTSSQTGDKDEPESEENSKDPSAEDIKDLLVQWSFDLSYLQCSMGKDSGRGPKVLDTLSDDIYKRGGIKEDSSRQRIVKSSQDYWQRTSLLFGLLA